MKRRSIFKSLALSTMAYVLPNKIFALSTETSKSTQPYRSAFSMDENNIRFIHPDIIKPFSVTMIADTHLFRDDARGASFTQYSGRMAKAYNHTKHFKTGSDTNPEDAFESVLQYAQDQKSAYLALVGDIFSFPSEAAVEWVIERLNKTSIPYLYTSGNHDWHYEGMEGTSASLRDTWIKNRLMALYQGRNPMMQKIQLNGVNIVVLDNSTYEISEQQLEYFKSVIAEHKPTVLMLHIPMYAPGRIVTFGCGHPDWNAKNDKNYMLERRLPWREEGHTKATMKFHETVFKSKNLLGVLAGHIHNQSVDIINGIPQVVTESNAEGGYLQINFTNHS